MKIKDVPVTIFHERQRWSRRVVMGFHPRTVDHLRFRDMELQVAAMVFNTDGTAIECRCLLFWVKSGKDVETVLKSNGFALLRESGEESEGQET